VPVPGFELDETGRSAAVGTTGEPLWVSLSPREFALCAALVGANGAVCSHDTLIAAVWDDGGSRRRLEVLVCRLRRRLRPLGVDVVGVRKRGYMLAVPA